MTPSNVSFKLINGGLQELVIPVTPTFVRKKQGRTDEFHQKGRSFFRSDVVYLCMIKRVVCIVHTHVDVRSYERVFMCVYVDKGLTKVIKVKLTIYVLMYPGFLL